MWQIVRNVFIYSKHSMIAPEIKHDCYFCLWMATAPTRYLSRHSRTLKEQSSYTDGWHIAGKVQFRLRNCLSCINSKKSVKLIWSSQRRRWNETLSFHSSEYFSERMNKGAGSIICLYSLNICLVVMKCEKMNHKMKYRKRSTANYI